LTWRIYDATREGTTDETRRRWLASPPPWREMPDSTPVQRPALPTQGKWFLRGMRYVASGPDEIDRVNIALLLRRPILVTGRPGVGKSSLAYNIAWAMDLGPPLRWEINSQSTLQDGLYTYDAVEHLRATQSRTSIATSATSSRWGRSGRRSSRRRSRASCSSTSSTRPASTCRTTC
jgi:hypothetical protein